MDNAEEFLKKKAELARLAQSSAKPAGYIGEAEKFLVEGSKPVVDAAKTTIKGVTDHINTNDVQKVLSGNQFQNKLASILESRAASKAAKLAGQAGGMMSSVGKRIPILGGLAVGLGTALTTGDASAGEQAAVPLLNEADPLGPEAGSLEYKLENGTITPQELEILRNRHNQ